MAHVRHAPTDAPEHEGLGSYSRLSSPRLIGRDEERALVLKAVLRSPAVVLIEGEGGVGKTRLMHDVLADPRLSGYRKLVGHSDPVDEPLPMEPVIHALGSVGDLPTERLSPLAGSLRPLVPELSGQLPPVPEPLEDPRAERHRLLRALVEVFSVLGPSVVTFEDIHWADPGTLEFLSYLTSHQPRELALVCTYRREELHNIGVSTGLLSQAVANAPVHVTLAPLEVAEVGMLVSSILGTDDVSAEFIHYLHEKTAGLPFAIEEVLRLLQERRDVVVKDGRWARRTLDALEVPAVVRDSILERVARLSADGRSIVEAAAVVGAPAAAELLADAARVGHVSEGLSDALISGLLEEKQPSRYDFRHALARQAVYDSVPSPRRRRMHRSVADALASPGEQLSHARIAHHYGEAGAEEQWAHHMQAAADRALELHDYSAACRLLEDVLRSQDDPADRGRGALKLGTAALEGMEHQRIAPLLEETLDAGVDDDMVGQVRLVRGLLLAQDGKADEAYAEVQRALQVLRDNRSRVRAMMLLAMPLVPSGTRTQHLAWLQRAQQEAADSDAPVHTALCFNRAATMLMLGDASALRLLDELPALDPTEKRRQVHRGDLVLAFSAAYVGRYAEADRWLSEHVSLSANTKDERLSSGTESTALLVDYALGRWDALEERARQVAADAMRVPCSWIDARTVLGQLLVARGKTRAAEDVLRGVIPVARQAGVVPLFAAASAGLARILVARGATRKAYDTAMAVVEVLRSKDVFMWGAEIWDPLSEVLLAAVEVDEADTLVSELETALAGMEAPAAHAAAAWARARIARARGSSDADAGFATAAQAWASLPRPFEAARVEAERASLLLERGDAAGEAIATEALESLTTLGAAWDVARVTRMMRAHGVGLPRPWRGGRKGYGGDLSPRESEIAILATEGKTNKEIAALLFLSPRTVENHLGSAMRKLGAGNRRELGDRLDRRFDN